MSAADPQDKCRVFVESNMQSHKPTHWFADIEAQVAGAPCARHKYSTGCTASPVTADVGILGSPCHPYSTQRTGRWKSGSVEDHREFQVGMQQFMGWLRRFEPKVQVFEQVLGFNMPFNSQTTETPLTRQPGCSKILRCIFWRCSCMLPSLDTLHCSLLDSR